MAPNKHQDEWDKQHQDEWDRQRQEIQTAYEDQLNKVGQYDKAANKKMATLVSSFYTVAASKLAKERPGITPVKLMNESMMRVTGGQSIETMAERLMEEGYLIPDEHGKYDAAEFENLLDRAARGDMIYSMFADYDLLLHGERQQMNVDRNNLDYIGVRLNRQDVAEMLEGMEGANNPEVRRHKPVEGVLLHGGDSTGETNSVDTQAAPGVASNSEVMNHGNGKAILESRLQRWRAANGLHDRRGARTVHGELEQATEAERDNGNRARPFTLGGESKETIKRQSDELIARAKEKGFFLDVEDYVALGENATPMKGGTEHDVLYVGENDSAIIIRSTKDGVYGFIDGSSPQQYLQRLARNNQVFQSTPIHLLGVSEGKDGEAVIWTAQSFVNGKVYDNERKFNMAMSDHGWEPHNRPNSYIHKASGAVIRDASKANVLYAGDKLFPIDVIIETMPDQGFLFQNDDEGDQQEGNRNVSRCSGLFFTKQRGKKDGALGRHFGSIPPLPNFSRFYPHPLCRKAFCRSATFVAVHFYRLLPT